MIYVASSLALCMTVIAIIAVNECKVRRQKIRDLFLQLTKQQETLNKFEQENLRLKLALAPFASKPETPHEPEEWKAARKALFTDRKAAS